eukprot:15065318-Ditylum_brightwellii.AAC.3
MEHTLQQAGGRINSNWVLQDSQPTVNVFCNGKLMTNIQRSDLIGDLPGFKAIWYQPDGIANVLVLASVQEGCHVMYNNHHENCFLVERSDGMVRKFQQSERGLYYSLMENNDYVLVNTVANNKTKHSPCNYSCIVTARNLQQTI